MEPNDFDHLLRVVMQQAALVKIPYSAAIDPHVRINTRAKKRFGLCICKDGSYTIELSAMLLNAPEKSCCQTLAHELIHTCRGCNNHGDLFRHYAAVMNDAYGYHIKRTNSPQELGIASEYADEQKAAAYLVKCLTCGKEYSRQRLCAVISHPSRYRCRCGGRLKRIR